MDEINHISYPRFFVQLDATARAALVGAAAAATYHRGANLFRAEDASESIYLLQHGRVKIFGLNEEGREQILWFCFPGDLFGVATVHDGHYGVHARACEASEVMILKRDDFRAFLLHHPQAALNVIELLSQRVRMLGDLVQSVASASVTERVAQLLSRLGHAYGRRDGDAICLDIPITHQEMADMIGTCRQSVTSALGVLKQTGAVEWKQRRVRISANLISSAVRLT